MRRRRIPIITQKIVSAVIIIGFLLCTVISIAGYWSFTTQFKTQYDASVLSISDAVRETLNKDKLFYYAEQKTADEEYLRTKVILQDFVDKFDLNLLYVSIFDPPEYSHITYIFNPVKKGGKWKEFPIGYEEDYINEQYSASIRRVYEYGEDMVRHTFNNRSGSHITANVPVFDKNGKVIAVVGAQKPVQEFVNGRHSYLRLILVVEIFFAIAFIFGFSAYFNKYFIHPIMMITRETDHFASWGGEPSDNLLNIKNRDELGILDHTVHQIASHLKIISKVLLNITLRLVELRIPVGHEQRDVLRYELSEVLGVLHHADDSDLTDLRIVDRQFRTSEELVDIAGQILKDEDESIDSVTECTEEPLLHVVLRRSTESSTD